MVNAEEHSFPVDVYSVGVIAYQMIVGKTPYAKAGGVALMDLMLGKYTPISATLGYSAPLVDLVHRCLATDPACRPTPAEVLASSFISQARQQMGEREKEAADGERESRAMRVDEELRFVKQEVEGLKERAAETEKEAERTRKEVEEWKGKTLEMCSLLAELRKEVDSLKVQQKADGISGRCTFLTTGTTFTTQKLFNCNTCFPGKLGNCVCAACAVKCHQNHDVFPTSYVMGYCDCGEGMAPLPCECLGNGSQK